MILRKEWRVCWRLATWGRALVLVPPDSNRQVLSVGYLWHLEHQGISIKSLLENSAAVLRLAGKWVKMYGQRMPLGESKTTKDNLWRFASHRRQRKTCESRFPCLGLLVFWLQIVQIVQVYAGPKVRLLPVLFKLRKIKETFSVPNVVEFWGWSFSRSSRSSADWKLGDFEARDVASPNGLPQCPSVSLNLGLPKASSLVPSSTISDDAILGLSHRSQAWCCLCCLQLLAVFGQHVSLHLILKANKLILKERHEVEHLLSLSFTFYLDFWPLRHASILDASVSKLFESRLIIAKDWWVHSLCVWKNSVANVACGLS